MSGKNNHCTKQREKILKNLVLFYRVITNYVQEVKKYYLNTLLENEF